MSELKEPSYIGKKPCGCIVMAISADPAEDDMQEVAKQVAKAINRGMTVELVEAQYVRTHKFGCEC